MFNPFKIHYVSLKSINRAEVEVIYAKNKKYISYIYCCFHIRNKKYKIRVDTSMRVSVIETETNGKEIIARTQRFADILNRDW